MNQTTIMAGVLALAMAAPAGYLAANAGTNRILSGPGCGTTGVLSGTGPVTCTYSLPGSDTFTVPAGVSRVLVTVTGAQGGNFYIAGDAAHGGSPAGDLLGNGGGNGGQASGTLTGLTAGQVLQVDVGGGGADGTAFSRSGGMGGGISGGLLDANGNQSGNPGGGLGGFGGSSNGGTSATGDAGGANGGLAFSGGNGSGGGGSSDVRVDPAGCAALTCSLADRVLVGAGGGGDGGPGGSGGASGGAGGGIPTQPVDQNTSPPSVGGAGGGVSGGNAGVSGDGATQSAGGIGAQNPYQHAAGAFVPDPRYGGDGGTGNTGSPGIPATTPGTPPTGSADVPPVGPGVGGTGNIPCDNPPPTNTNTPNRNPPPGGPACSGGPNSTATTSGGAAGGGGGGGYLQGGGGSGGGGLFGGNGGGGGGGGGGSSFAAAGVVNPALTPGVNGSSPTPGNPPAIADGQVTIAFAAATTTTLGVTPANRAGAGTAETLTATVAPQAPGTVQFFDGSNALGAPVPVGAGTASLTTTLASGVHSLSAAFNPTDPTAFVGSASLPVPYTVNPKRPLCLRRPCE